MKVYQVLTSMAHMPTNCWGRYGNIAIALVDTDKLRPGTTRPCRISTHSRGVISIPHYSGRLNRGGKRSAFTLEFARLTKLCDELNQALELLRTLG